MPEDLELLRDYARNRTESAFAELVRRHVNLVYSAALRETHGDTAQAEDVSQAVFTELAGKAARLCDHPALAGWLYTCVRQMAANARRSNERRQRREQEAHEMNALISPEATDASWREVRPVIDDAMHELNDIDRTAVVLRYFENQSHEDVGKNLGLTETAARKRVDRALEKLRSFLVKRGVTVGTGALVVTISSNAVHAAPVGLAATISTTAALATPVIAAVTAATTANIIAMTTIQKTLAATAIIAVSVTTPLLIQHQAKVKLREENRQQMNQLALLQTENERLSNLLAQASQSQSPPKDLSSELLRLRGEVGILRQQSNTLAKLQLENQRLKSTMATVGDSSKNRPQIDPRSESLPKESWAFVGYSDPESAFQSTAWAMSHGDAANYLASLAPEGREFTEAQVKAGVDLGEQAKQEIEKVTAFKIIEKQAISDNEAVLTVYASGVNEAVRFKMQRFGNDWKFAGPIKDKGQASTK